jgi:Leucine-rich repeat (LRR) protein
MFRSWRWGVIAAALICGIMPAKLLAQDAAGDKAIADIQKSGGKVDRDEAAPGKPVITVNLGVSQVNDAGLEPLKAFPKLQRLTLNNTKITDAGLEHLKPLTGLQKLYIVDVPITDAGLERLKGLSNLRVLSLVGTNITDAGLAHIKGMTNLQEVFLASTKVTDAGIKSLKEALPKVKVDR